MKVGNNLYTKFKKNNLRVWSLAAVTVITIISSFTFSFMVFNASQQNLFGITDKGVLVPLERLDGKRDKLKIVKSNLDYFVSLYYVLDGFTMKEKKEKLYWLLGTQPTTVVKDRDKKGYFNTFLSINGLKQHAFIDQNSWKVYTIDEPYKISFNVVIVRINNESKTYYTSEVLISLKDVNRNYPYNPYGLLITSLSENLSSLEEKEFRKIQRNNIIENSQN